MKGRGAGEHTASCSECPSTFERIPPADPRYKYPREEPTDKDYKERIYECENGHRNKIYWERESGPVVIASPDPLERAYDHESSLY